MKSSAPSCVSPPTHIDSNGLHYNDVIMCTIASQITSLMIVFSTVYLDTDQRKHQSSASLAFGWGIHRMLVNSLHKWPVMRKMFLFDDVIMWILHSRLLTKADSVNVLCGVILLQHSLFSLKLLTTGNCPALVSTKQSWRIWVNATIDYELWN